MIQGNIWVVRNSLGLAESMTLVLRLQLPAPTRMYEPEGSSDHPPSYSLLRGLKVLVADDDDVNRAVTRKLLEKLGCHVSAVASGFECLSVINATGLPFQVVLLDLHMPEMDGFEVAMRIRKHRSGSWPLIVALTASADNDVRERCSQVGMNGIIRKPVLLQGMRDELQRILCELQT
ncbi:Enoyl-[acyl-carrier-protein] reductase [NADPH, B-specific] 2, mitochondrial [Asimina triloba]